LNSPTEKQERGLKGRLVSGLSAKIFTLSTIIVTQLILLPFFIKAWGADTYQSWLVILSAASLLGLGEFGIGNYLRSAIRMAGAAGNIEKVNRFLAIAAVLYAGVFCFLLTVVMSFSYLMHSFDVFGNLNIRKEQIIFIFCILSANSIIYLLIGPVTAISHGYGEQGRAEVWHGSRNVAQIVVTICFLLLGLTPVWVASGHLAVTILIVFLRFVDVGRRHPQVRFSMAIPTRSELHEATKISGLHVMPTWQIPIINSAPILLLNSLATFGLAAVTFRTSQTFIGFVRMFSWVFLQVTGVELSRQFGQNAQTAQTRLFENCFRIVAMAIGFLSGFVVFISGPFIHLWTRGEVPYDQWLIIVLIVRIFICAPAVAAHLFFQNTNQPAPAAISSTMYIGVFLILGVFLIPPYGALGAAVALFAGEAVSGPFYIYPKACKFLKVDAARLALRSYGMAIVTFGISGSLAYLAILPFEFKSILELLAAGVIWGGLTVFPALWLLFTNSQRQWLWSVAQGLLGRLRRGAKQS
jgi:O-antigen/teichoic acid export membrane protein